MFVVDGNNVMGSRPDGWWRDRAAGMQRLVSELDARAAATGEEIVVIFDGEVRALTAAHVEIAFAAHADDLIAERAQADTTVVTSDRELADRARAVGAHVIGSRSFLRETEGV